MREHTQDRNINDMRYCVDDSKLAALGWSPTVEWQDGLKSTVRARASESVCLWFKCVCV